MKLAILFLEYGNGKYPNSFVRFKPYADKLDCSKCYYIIDNMEKENYLIESSNMYRINGDNSNWEFSGWQKGINYLRQNNIHYDAILFANDAFFAYGWSLLEYSNKLNLNKWLQNGNSMMGHIDTKDIELEVFGSDVSHWICTNCFFLPKHILEKMDSIVSVSDEILDTIVSHKFPGGFEKEAHNNYFQLNSGLNDNYKSMIITWLTKEWHGKLKINETTWDFFRNKVRSLLNESLLTSRIKNLGYYIESYKNYI